LGVEIVNPELIEVAEDDVLRSIGHQVDPVLEALVALEVTPVAEEWRQIGVFPAAVPVPDDAPLMQRLLSAGYKVLLETSGERPLESVPAGVVKIVDVKCPDSGEADTFRMENLTTLRAHDEVKFVISDRVDYEFARAFTIQHDLAGRVNAVLFSPAFSKDASGARDASKCLLDPQRLAGWMLEDNVPARLGLQIHKLIWDPAMKGV